MKKALTFLSIWFCFSIWPPREGISQSDSTVTKRDVQLLDKKDSLLSEKIPHQFEKAKALVNEIASSKPEKIIKFKTVVKRHVRTDSFYVFVDTCLTPAIFIRYPVHDTIWVPYRDQRQGVFKRLFGNKKLRKNEIKPIQ